MLLFRSLSNWASINTKSSNQRNCFLECDKHGFLLNVFYVLRSIFLRNFHFCRQRLKIIPNECNVVIYFDIQQSCAVSVCQFELDKFYNVCRQSKKAGKKYCATICWTIFITHIINYIKMTPSIFVFRWTYLFYMLCFSIFVFKV